MAGHQVSGPYLGNTSRCPIVTTNKTLLKFLKYPLGDIAALIRHHCHVSWVLWLHILECMYSSENNKFRYYSRCAFLHLGKGRIQSAVLLSHPWSKTNCLTLPMCCRIVSTFLHVALRCLRNLTTTRFFTFPRKRIPAAHIAIYIYIPSPFCLAHFFWIFLLHHLNLPDSYCTFSHFPPLWPDLPLHDIKIEHRLLSFSTHIVWHLKALLAWSLLIYTVKV